MAMARTARLDRNTVDIIRAAHAAGAYGNLSFPDALVHWAKSRGIDGRALPLHAPYPKGWHGLYLQALSAVRAHRGLPAHAVENTEAYHSFETDSLIVKSTLRWGYAHNDPQTIYGTPGA